MNEAEALLSNSTLVIFIIEIVILTGIIVLQFYSFFNTKRKIDLYAKVFPKKPTLIELNELDETGDDFNIFLIYPESESSNEFVELANYINLYLRNTKDIGAEITIINEVVESHSSMAEENVTATLFTPMYIGLMGTFVGIILGVLGMVISTRINGGVYEPSDLLLGVGFAMTASLIGLILSVINSNLIFVKAKLIFDKGRIKFNSFVQTELLPSNNKQDTSSITSLNSTIRNFNSSFNEKLNKLGGYLEKNMDSFKAQESLLDKFDKINLKQVTEVNIKLLDNLSSSADKLSLLNQSLNNVNLFVSESSNLSKEANQLFARFVNFENNSQKIADEISDKLNLSTELLEFLKAHFSEMKQLGQLTRNAVANVDENLSETIDELNKAVKTRQSTFVNSISDMDEALKKTLDELHQHLAAVLSDLVNQTDAQAKFVGTAHETAIKKFDDSIDGLSKNISDKIEKLNKVANEETIRLEKVINENKTSLGKLNQLDPINYSIKSVSDKMGSINNNTSQLLLAIDALNHKLQKNSNTSRVYDRTKPKTKSRLRRFFTFRKKKTRK